MQLRQGVGRSPYHHIQNPVRGRDREAAAHRLRVGRRIGPVRIEARLVHQVVRPRRRRRHHARAVIRPLDVDGQLGNALIPIRILHRVPDVVAQVRARRQRLRGRLAIVQHIGPGAGDRVLGKGTVTVQRGDRRSVVMPARAPPHEHRRGVRPASVVAQHVAIQAARHILGQGPPCVIGGRRHIVEYHHIQAGAGAVAIAICQYNIETLGQSRVIGRLVVGLVIAQGVAVSHRAGACHRVVADSCHQQLIAQRAWDPLRETGDDLAVTDQYHATQSQALDTICRIEGEDATLSQVRSIRAAAICQCSFIQDNLTTVYLQPFQGNGFIHGSNGNRQYGDIRIGTIGHNVVDRRH